MILQKHWDQIEPLSTINESYFDDDLTSNMFEFIMTGNYKNYYTNHVVIEIHKNVARLFNKNTEEYIGIGFYNTKEK